MIEHDSSNFLYFYLHTFNFHEHKIYITMLALTSSALILGLMFPQGYSKYTWYLYKQHKNKQFNFFHFYF